MVRLPRIAVNTLVAVASICLTLVVIEIVFRVFVPQQYFNVLVRTWDRELGLKHIPGAKGVIITPEFKTKVAINSKGLRDREYPYAKPQGTRRVLCLGDSFTFGMAVEMEETFAKVLERMLSSEEGRLNHWEVINAGVPGTGTAHQLTFFNAEGYRYQPDFVVLCICGGNDFSDNISCGLYSYEDGRLLKHDAHFSRGDKVRYILQRVPGYALLSRSHLMSFLKQRIVGFVAHHTDRGPRSQAAITARNRAACDLTEQLLLSLRDSCASKNSILVATVVPQSLINTKQQMVTNLLGFMKAQGFHYVDLSPRFARTDGERTKLYYAVDGHWTASGHRLVAEVLCDFFAGSSLPNK